MFEYLLFSMPVMHLMNQNARLNSEKSIKLLLDTRSWN